MPFYEYQCRNCGHHLEVLQKISDGPLKKCPACGRSQLARIVSRVAFRLKGGGWYETDFKSDAENKRNLVGQDSAAGDGKTVDPTAKADSGKSEAPASDAAKPDAGKSDAGGDAKSRAAPGKTPAKSGAVRKAPAKAAPARARTAATSKPKPKPKAKRR